MAGVSPNQTRLLVASNTRFLELRSGVPQGRLLPGRLRRLPRKKKLIQSKAISWRVLGSMDTLFLLYFFTRNLAAASSIAMAESFTKIVLFYIHERA